MPGEAPWRAKLQAALVLAVGGVGILTGLVLVYFQLHNTAEVNAYRSARPCSAPIQAISGEACKYAGAASVTGASGGDAPAIDVTFSGLRGRTFVAQTSADNLPSRLSMVSGAQVTAELWNGKVTTFAGVKTFDSPDFLPTDLLPAAGFIAVLGAAVSAWSLTLVRKAWRR